MAIFTVPGKDVITISDHDFLDDTPHMRGKVHLIRLNFLHPDNNRMEWVINKFPQTNRYIVDAKNIKFYNYYLKRTSLKYYIINTNTVFTGLISFYKRNNKVLLDITALQNSVRLFLLEYLLYDILENTEVIIISKDDYDENSEVIDRWRGNCIIKDTNYPI